MIPAIAGAPDALLLFRVLAASTMIPLVAFAVLRLARRLGPDGRGFLCRISLVATLGGMILCALLPASVPTVWRIPAESGVYDGSAGPLPGPRVLRQPVSAPPNGPFTTASVPDDAIPAVSAPRMRWTAGWAAYLIAVWIAGVAWLGIRLAVSFARTRRLRRISAPVTDSGMIAELRAACAHAACPVPPLRMHESVSSPFLARVPGATIFLPASLAAEANPGALRGVLAHEAAHIVRRDPEWNLAAHITCALLWLQPLLWVLVRRMEFESELACDTAAAQCCGSPKTYAEQLVRLVERLNSARHSATRAACGLSFQSSLGRRVERLMSGGEQRTIAMKRTHRIAAVSAAAMVAACAAVLSPSGAEPRQAQTGKTGPGGDRVTQTSRGRDIVITRAKPDPPHGESRPLAVVESGRRRLLVVESPQPQHPTREELLRRQRAMAAEIAALKARVRALEQRRPVTSPAASLRQARLKQLYQLRMLYADNLLKLHERYSDQHPILVAARKRLAAIDQVLEAQSAAGPTTAKGGRKPGAGSHQESLERLDAEISAEQARLGLTRARLELLQSGAELGVESSSEINQVQAEVDAQLRQMQALIDERARLLRGGR